MGGRQGAPHIRERDHEERAHRHGGAPKYGTPILVNMINKMGALGTRNLMSEIFENCEPISGEYMHEFPGQAHHLPQMPVGVRQELPDERRRVRRPGVETTRVRDHLRAGDHAGHRRPWRHAAGDMLCDELGLATISAGVTLSLAFECMEKGLLSEKDVGEPLKWGDSATMLRLLEDMTHRKGFGDRLAEGGKRLAAEIGGDAPNLLYASRGLELPAHSARALKGMSIGYATGTRAAATTRTPPPCIRLGPRQHIDRGEARVRRSHQNFTALGGDPSPSAASRPSAATGR